MATQYAFGKIVTDGLVLCLDAADRNSYVSGSTTWFDVAGSNNGTLTNGPTFNTGNGGSIVFDGVDDKIVGNAFTPNITNKTLQGWCKLSSTTQQGGGLINLQSAAGELFDAIVYNETNQGWGFGSSNFNRTAWSGVKETSTNDWVFMCATYANSNYNLYRNGVLILNTTSYAALTFDFSSRVQLGERHTGGTGVYLAASIASGALYNRALSSSEVLQNYSAQKSRFGL